MSQHDTLTQALEQIAMAAEATVCNPAWIAKHARAALSTPAQAQQPPYAWAVSGASTMFFGPTAEYDARQEAKHCGGTAEAFPLFKEAQAAQGEPVRHVGDSKFESWYQAHPKANGGDKQLARDAYAAGMSDPVAHPTVAQGAGEAYAYAVYFPDQPTEMLVHDLDEMCEEMMNREHTVTQLFTQPAAGADVLDAERLRHALESEDFAICQWCDAFGEPCWIPISEFSAIDAAIAASGRQK